MARRLSSWGENPKSDTKSTRHCGVVRSASSELVWKIPEGFSECIKLTAVGVDEGQIRADMSCSAERKDS